MICAHQITGNHFGKWPMLWYSFWPPTCNHISSRAHRTVSFKSLMGLKRSWAIQCWKNSAGQPASLEEWIDDVSSRTFFRMGLEGLKCNLCIPPYRCCLTHWVSSALSVLLKVPASAITCVSMSEIMHRCHKIGHNLGNTFENEYTPRGKSLKWG